VPSVIKNDDTKYVFTTIETTWTSQEDGPTVGVAHDAPACLGRESRWALARPMTVAAKARANLIAGNGWPGTRRLDAWPARDQGKTSADTHINLALKGGEKLAGREEEDRLAAKWRR
jgi:hypothetical protein